MKRGKQMLIRMVAFAVILSALACKQPDAPSAPSPVRSTSGAADDTAVAETLLALLYIAGRQTRDSGGCTQIKERKARRTHQTG